METSRGKAKEVAERLKVCCTINPLASIMYVLLFGYSLLFQRDSSWGVVVAADTVVV